MNELSKYLVEQVLLEENTIKNTIVVYSGRFQPFHKGHYKTYEGLVKKFGKNNVYIGTSNKVQLPKSPFNFKEKKKVMTTMFGIPSSKIVQIKNPYAPTEILKKFDEDTTAYITVVGEKDANRLAGKYFTKYDGKVNQPYKEKGYVYISPSQSNPISGTEVRNGLGNGNEKDKKEFFTKRVYPKFNKSIFNLITKKLNETFVIDKQTIEDWLLSSNILNEGSSNNDSFGSADDGPTFMYPNYDIFNKISAKRARKIGYEVVNMIMNKELEDYYDHPEYPNGPTQAVSYYPAGVLGKMTPNNQFDIYSNKAYDKWYTHMTRKATLAGYEIVFTQLERDAAKKIRKMAGNDAKGDEEFKHKLNSQLSEAITLPIEIGDTLLMGKFKNKKVVVKSIGKDEHGVPTINGKNVFTFRYGSKAPNIFDNIVEFEDDINEIAGTEHRCRKCGHSWSLEVEDNENYTCHNCGWDSQSQKYNLDSEYIKKNGLLGKPKTRIFEAVVDTFQNLGILRKDMPQIQSGDMDKYLKYLTDNGIKYQKGKFPIYKLKLTQKDINLDKVEKLSTTNKSNLSKPIVISKDNYILDGHHRVLALYSMNEKETIPTIKVNLPIMELLKTTHRFDDVSYKSVNEANDKLKLRIPSDIKKIHSAFKKNGKKLYVVGGAVRDAILGKSPKDFDLATDAKPDETLEIAKKAGFNTAEVGKTFGVVIVGGHEIATFRKDVGRGRRPDAVDYTDIEGDVKRRDLTINALFYDMDRGEIVDLVGGIEDLKKNRIRTVGKATERFDEDPLRKLRALRFQTRLGGKMDTDVMNALKQNPTLKGVSSERIRDEFLKSIKTSKYTSKYMEILDKIGFTELILPNLKVSKPYINSNDPIIFLSYLLRDNDPSKLGKKLNKLNYTTDETKNIVFLNSLQKFKPESVYSFKKSQERTSLNDNQILEFGKLIGKDMKKFLKFNLSVRGNEVPTGIKGPEIGKWIRNREKEKFLNESINEMAKSELDRVEKYADKNLSPEDIVFTKHFFDRVNDPRNGKEITDSELIGFFKRLSKHKKKFIEFLNKFKELTITDKKTNINIPLVKQSQKIIAKTVMRKKDWKSNEKVLKFEGDDSQPYINEEKVKYYEQYIRNLTPENFDITTNGNKIEIHLKESIKPKISNTKNKVKIQKEINKIPNKISEVRKNDSIESIIKDIDLYLENILTENLDVKLSKKYGIKLDIYEYDDYLELNRIVVPDDKRNMGIGSKVMNDIIEYSKKHNKDIFLTPSTDFGGTMSRLVKFYKSFGFRPNKGSNRDFRSKESMILTV